MYKVIVIDDEAAGRSLIKQYLKDFPSLILVAEANNGVDAVREINTYKPDLIFLDVQMPGLTGFEVLNHLKELPQIIFSTAYDKYALKAFDVHAIDYLLKPYEKERFKLAVGKVKFGENQTGIAPLAENLMLEQPGYPERILVEFNKKLITIAANDIYWIEAYGDYSKLHTEGDSYISNFGITQLEEKLNPSVFLRVHRSSIVNLNAIKQLDKYGKTYQITLNNKATLRVSRGYMDAVKRLIF